MRTILDAIELVRFLYLLLCAWFFSDNLDHVWYSCRRRVRFGIAAPRKNLWRLLSWLRLSERGGTEGLACGACVSVLQTID